MGQTDVAATRSLVVKGEVALDCPTQRPFRASPRDEPLPAYRRQAAGHPVAGALRLRSGQATGLDVIALVVVRAWLYGRVKILP